MPEFLRSALAGAPATGPVDLVIRLGLAVALGWLVAVAYRASRNESDIVPTFPGTLVLLAALIAMVTQVIGDNIARAFSLVGALSIVRFRTVVRDTQDTAFVIFAVVVGMAVGAGHLMVAGGGLIVVGGAAILMKPRAPRGAGASAPSDEQFFVSLRVGLGHDIEAVVGPALDAALKGRYLVSMRTAKQGMSVDVSYRGFLRPGANAESLLKTLNRLDGIQNVELALHAPVEE
ncbi:MAG TPA: DUF4956 domain-containing protein [Vicinamibacterales bacterium]|nr:DUF4956 domain-containing protein [Vicinamibacterales bacterium]